MARPREGEKMKVMKGDCGHWMRHTIETPFVAGRSALGVYEGSSIYLCTACAGKLLAGRPPKDLVVR